MVACQHSVTGGTCWNMFILVTLMKTSVYLMLPGVHPDSNRQGVQIVRPIQEMSSKRLLDDDKIFNTNLPITAWRTGNSANSLLRRVDTGYVGLSLPSLAMKKITEMLVKELNLQVFLKANLFSSWKIYYTAVILNVCWQSLRHSFWSTLDKLQ